MGAGLEIGLVINRLPLAPLRRGTTVILIPKYSSEGPSDDPTSEAEGNFLYDSSSAGMHRKKFLGIFS